MGWKTYARHTGDVTSREAPELPGIYRARVDGLLMGKVVEFGITNRCATCKGTGRYKGKASERRRCSRCKGLGYIQPDDLCMCVCGCTNVVHEQLVFVCMSCFDETAHYSPSAFDVS